MKVFVVISAILAVAQSGESNKAQHDNAFHSSSGTCTLANVKVYDDAIWNVILTQHVHCFADILGVKKAIKDETPAKSFTVYHDIGPFIGQSTTLRLMSVLQDKVDTIDLGPMMTDEGNDECLLCILDYYKGDMLKVTCNPEPDCPDRLTKGLYWGPKNADVTFSSPVSYCTYERSGVTDYYYCKDYHPDNHMV